MLTIAHRGYADDYPENSIEAISVAAQTSDIVEIDVRMSADSVPVVVHDANLKRLRGVDVEVAACLADTLEAEYAVPRLSTVLETVDTPLLVELKTETDVEEVITRCERSDSEVMYQSFNPRTIERIPADCPTVVLVATPELRGAERVPENVLTTTLEAIEFADRVSADGIAIHHSVCEPRLLGQLQTEGLDVFVWTVRSHELGSELAALDVDGLITDSPRYIQ